MVEDNFVEEAFEEISQDERAKILANARVVAALKGKTETFGSIRVGEEDIRFRLSISKGLRKKMALYKSKASVGEPEMKELNSLLYDLLSALCVDDPWTEPKTWSVYDDGADIGALDILLEMMKQVKAHMVDLKDFRGGGRRITPVADLQVPVRPAQ